MRHFFINIFYKFSLIYSICFSYLILFNLHSDDQDSIDFLIFILSLSLLNYSLLYNDTNDI